MSVDPPTEPVRPVHDIDETGGDPACWAHLFDDEDVCQTPPMAQNVVGTDLQMCSTEPLTGFYRNGCCDTGPEDMGVHTVCAVMTAEFLEFSASVGNDLSTPHPEYGFAGLQPGDRWCLCAERWSEALAAGRAPNVVLEATHARTLEWADLADLRAHAASDPGAH